MLKRIGEILTRTPDDAGRAVAITGREPPQARKAALESARALWVDRGTWVKLIVIQLILVSVLAVVLNSGINALTDAAERAGIRQAVLSRRAAFFGIISLQTLSFAAIVSTIIVFRPAWMLARARQRVVAGLCGSCAYDLTGVDGDARGLKVCPECGATWDTAKRRPTPAEWLRGITPTSDHEGSG